MTIWTCSISAWWAVTNSEPRTLGWGIVGASTAAARHFLPALRTVAGHDHTGRAPVRAVAVTSSNRRRAHEFATHQHLPHAYDDLEAMLSRPDIQCVYIANQIQRHTDAVRIALDAGKHVLCEPPIAMDADEAEALVHRAALRGLHLWTNQFWRFDPVIRHMRQELADGTIGDLLGMSIENETLLAVEQQTWRLQPGAGILNDRTAQDVDLALFLSGRRPQQVWASSGQQLLGTHTDIAEEIAAVLQLPGRVLVRVHDVYAHPHAGAAVSVHGTYATLRATDWSDPSTPTRLVYRRRTAETPLEITPTPPYVVSLTEFMRAVRTTSPAVDARERHAQDALETLHVIEALRQSVVRGHVVRPAYDTPTTR